MIIVFKSRNGDILELPCSEIISIDGIPYTSPIESRETTDSLSVRVTALEVLVSQLVPDEEG